MTVISVTVKNIVVRLVLLMIVVLFKKQHLTISITLSISWGRSFFSFLFQSSYSLIGLEYKPCKLEIGVRVPVRTFTKVFFGIIPPRFFRGQGVGGPTENIPLRIFKKREKILLAAFMVSSLFFYKNRNLYIQDKTIYNINNKNHKGGMIKQKKQNYSKNSKKKKTHP